MRVDRFHFRVSGLTRGQVRRLRRLQRPQSRLLNALPVVLLVAGLIYVAGALTKTVGPVLFDPPIRETRLIGVGVEPFTSLGGQFDLSVSPLDRQQRPINARLDLDSFSFREVVLTPVDAGSDILVAATVVPVSVEWASPSRLSAVLLLDNSGSMEDNDSEGRRFTAGKLFIERLSEGNRVAVMDFHNGQVRVHQTFDETQQFGIVLDQLKQENPTGGTPLYRALSDALRLLEAEETSNKCVIMLTDGKPDRDSSNFNDAVELAIRGKVSVFPIGLGEKTDTLELQRLAVRTKGSYARAEVADNLKALFDSIALSATQGRTIIHARGDIPSPGLKPGLYDVTGILDSTSLAYTTVTPFDFRAEVR